MKNVRLWYRKDGACRFISHLDINRTITRALQMSGVPLWHTEGFNSRMYVSFALPLSLGFRGEYESVDVRLLEDDYPTDVMIEKINGCLPEGLCIYEAGESLMKPGDIAYAHFIILITAELYSPEEILACAQRILSGERIVTEKKTKKGAVKEVDLKENIVRYNLELSGSAVKLDIVLPAGSVKNVNPSLLTDIIEKECGCDIFTDVTRVRLYDDNFELFR